MSVVVTLNLDTISQNSAKAVMAALACLVGPVEVAPTTNFREVSAKEAIRRPIPSQLPVAVDLAQVDDDPTPEPEAAPEPAKKKPGRPRKEVAVEPVDPTPSEKPSESEAPEIPAAAPSLDDLRAALTTLTTTKGMAAGLELLKANNCARVSEVANLSVEAQLAFIGACNA